KPCPRLHTCRLVPFVRGHAFYRLAERPDVAFGIDGAISAVAIELRSRLHRDLRARLARALAMRVNVSGDLDVYRLGVEAVDRGGTLVHGTPFGADHDETVAEAHFRMNQLVIGSENDHRWLEAERFFEPAQRLFRILVADGRRDRRAVFRVVH